MNKLHIRLGCAVFVTIFYSRRIESKRKIWMLFASYSHVLVYSQTPFIRIIRFIIASKYSHRFIYRYSIWCKNICCSEYLLQTGIFAYVFLILANTCFKILVQKWILQNFKWISQSGKYSLANIRIQANIACKCSHTGEYSVCIASNI